MDNLIYSAQFTKHMAGHTGLTVTVNVDRVTLSTGTRTALITAASATEARNGAYIYRLANAEPILYDYIVVFSTTDNTVDLNDVLGTLQPDPAARITNNILSAAVPDAYVSGSVGVALGRIGSAQVTITSPVSDDGAIILIYGDDYKHGDGRALTFSGTNWPTLTGGTISLRVQAGSVIAISGTVTSASTCRVEITSAQTISIGLGVWTYDLEATLASGFVATLQQGTITIRRDVR
jgi:hypothetical protein